MQGVSMSKLGPGDVRARCRSAAFDACTAGLARGFTQANLLAVPAASAPAFLEFCSLNSAACPVLEALAPGDVSPKCAPGADLRIDLPRYRVFEFGEPIAEPTDVLEYWRKDLVAVLLGCSFTFEHALLAAGVPLRHVELGVAVPMYRMDAHCRAVATTVGAGDGVWHAYLSTQARQGQTAVNARDRIGTGPWYNFDGVTIARDVAHLHGDTLELAQLGNNLTKQSGLTEKGQIVPGLNDYPHPRDGDWDYVRTTPYSNRHEILTGSQPDGRAYPADLDFTCDSWTSNADPEPGTAQIPLEALPNKPNAQIGFPDRNGGGNGSWNSSHGTRGCSQRSLVRTHGVGKFYCFAVD